MRAFNADLRDWRHLNLRGIENVARRKRGKAKRFLGYWRFLTT